MPLLGRIGSAAARGFGFLGKVVAIISDTYFYYITLLLHGNGTNGVQNNTFLDSSTNNFTITRGGNTTQGTFTPYGSNWSNYFNGSSSYLNTSQNAAFTFSGDFTVEFWVFITNNQQTDIVGTANNTAFIGSVNSGWVISYYTASGIRFGYQSANAWVFDLALGMTPTMNTWNHIAVVRSGSTITGYLNGVAGSTPITNGSTLTSNIYGVYIGAGAANAAGKLTGSLSNLRIVKGTAVYTGAFTPPAAPLTAIANTVLLTCQSNRFIDNSSNAFALTLSGSPSVQRFSPFSSTSYSTSVIGGSAYFDGTGDYLNTPASSQFAPAGDFTISLWYYPVTLNAYNTVLANYTSTVSTDWSIEVQSDGGIFFYFNGSSIRITSSAGTIVTGRWHFITVARSGTTITAYVNGVSQGTYTLAGTFGTTIKSIYVGSQGGGIGFITGYLADIQLIDGSVVTTIPTAPLTAVTGTKLLLNFTNGGIFDNAKVNNLETVGSAQISTAQSKFGGASMYFPASTGNRLTIPANALHNFYVGDFTVELWFYWQNTGSNGTNVSPAHIIGDADPNLGAGSWSICIEGSPAGTLIQLNGATTSQATYSVSLSTSTWYHLAVVRSGTSVYCFLNGTSRGTNTITGTQAIRSNFGNLVNPVYIGSHPSYAGMYFDGYIDDIRITKGYARYTTNFTAPTAAFSDQ